MFTLKVLKKTHPSFNVFYLREILVQVIRIREDSDLKYKKIRETVGPTVANKFLPRAFNVSADFWFNIFHDFGSGLVVVGAHPYLPSVHIE